MRWRQDLIDEFLNSGECYHGVYYQIPSERSQKHKKKKEKEGAARRCVHYVVTKLPFSIPVVCSSIFCGNISMFGHV